MQWSLLLPFHTYRRCGFKLVAALWDLEGHVPSHVGDEYIPDFVGVMDFHVVAGELL